jgi:hypothetical protein
MKQDDKFTVINIREYLKKNADDEGQFGEDTLRQLLSEFSCERNQDVEGVLKRQAIDFTNKNQSVTYLVFATDDAQLLGYFALTIKPITVSGEPFSNTVRKKLSRVSTLNEEEHTYSLAAYLIAQLGKNYADGANERITGAELLGLAVNQIELLQYQAGGMVIFLEANNEDKLLSFYGNNRFQPFDRRTAEKKDKEPHELIQLLRLL